MKSKNLVSLILLLGLTMNFVGCYTIRIGGKAELAPSATEGTKVAEKRCGTPFGDWFLLVIIPPILSSLRPQKR